MAATVRWSFDCVSWRRALVAGVAVVGILAAASPVWAGNTGMTALFKPIGATAASGSGDYVSTNSGGLGGTSKYFTYFIEVPPGQTRLVVDLFDADVGIGGDADRTGNRDWDYAGTGWDGTTTYSLYNPSGVQQTTVFSQGTDALPVGADNAWLTLFDSNVSPAPVLQTSTNATGNGVASLALTVPTGTAADNLLIAAIARDLDGTSGAVTAPTGWSPLDQGDCPTATCHLAIFYQVVTTVPASPQTFTWTGAQRVAGAMFRFSGVDTSSPFDTAVATRTGSTADPVAPAVTTATANALVLRIAGAGPSVAFTPPTGHAEIWDAGSGAGGDAAVRGSAATVTQTTPGSAGTATFTAATNRWRTATVALRPVASSAPAAGHWELRVDLSAAGGDEINAFGLRAHEGDPGATGVEYNVYYQPYTQFGTDNATDGTDTMDFVNYPWVTSGCGCYMNNWDGDGAGTFAFDRPDRTTNPAGWVQVGATITASGATVWGHDAITDWTSNPDAASYGIWRLRHQSIEWSAGAGNIYTFYMTDYNNATAPPPPPTAQQQANSLRVYLPTDTGGAPLKPYLEQYVRMTAGPAVTPVVGTTYRLTVSVRVVNPTPHAITFSAANLVTANVPGTLANGTVVYAGNLEVSQGSATPPPGTSGNITWNPGTLAAGAAALMSYEVDATPQVDGVLDVTGTPAANGTTARYVDETGSSAARALITLGPICQVAISTDEPTQAVLAGLWSHRHAEGLVVGFVTASEVGTAGYRLERLSPTTGTFEAANERAILPALPEAPQGAVYHVLDRGADSRVAQTYRLVEIEISGTERDLGTYVLTPEDGSAPEMATNSTRTARERQVAPSLPVGTVPSSAARITGVKIAVETPGLYWLGADEIAQQLALPVEKVLAAIQARGFALSNRGQAVAWLPGPGGSGLSFVGEALDSIYARANVYVLTPGTGVVMAPTGSRVAPGTRPLLLSPTAVHAEQEAFAVTSIPLDPESDYWFWDWLEAGSPTQGRRSFAVDSPALSPAGGQATIVAHLLGFTTTGVPGEHHAVVYVNGVQVGEAIWQGVVAHDVTATVSQSLLHDGANTVEVEAVLGSGVAYSYVCVDSFDLTYQRLHVAQASALEVAVPGGRPVAIDGFADGDVRVFDLADPKRPTYLSKVGVTPGSGGFTATFTSPMSFTVGPRRLLTVSAAGVKAPARIWADAASNLRATSNAADYVVVTAGPLLAAAEQLAAYRQVQGLATRVVDIEDVYDEFNAGIPNPHALRSFLAHAHQAWVSAPRAVVLAAAGTSDYRDLLGFGGNFVPPLMVSTPGGLSSSDLSFGDLAGNDGVPEVAIGRLPVTTPAELAAALAKIQAYEAEGAAPWTGTAVVVADDPEGGFDFGHDSDTLASRLGGLAPNRLYLGPLSATQVHTELTSAWSDGAAVVTYLGHGGIDRWAQESLFSIPDVASLGNGPRLPVVASLTCVIGRYEVPGFDCLASALVRQADGGAIGVWAPSGIANHADSLLLGQVFAEALWRDDVLTVGDACIRALAGFHTGGGNPATAIVYNYFGDPMVRLRPFPPPPPPGSGGDPGAP
jgi:hypothetical protein